MDLRATALGGDEATQWDALRKKGVELDMISDLRRVPATEMGSVAGVLTNASPLIAFALLSCFDAIADCHWQECGDLVRLAGIATPGLFGTAAVAGALHERLARLAMAFKLRNCQGEHAHIAAFPTVAQFIGCEPVSFFCSSVFAPRVW